MCLRMERMKSKWLVHLASFLLAVTLSQSLLAQELPSPKLRVKDVVLVEQNFGPLLVKIPVKCDAKGNVYLNHYERGKGSALPITRISPNGKPLGTIRIQAVSDFEQADAFDSAIGPSGEVYILVATQSEPKAPIARSIVRFTPEGKFDSAFELQSYLDAHHIAVFATGEFLLAGEELSEADGKPTGRPLLALYDRVGRFVSEISLPRDLQVSSDPSDTSQGQEPGLYSLTHAVAGDDGNIYLMRRTAAPLVYVITPAGSVLRRLVIPPPAEDFEPVTLKVAGGKIVIQFNQKERSGSLMRGIFSVVDAHTGEKWADYRDTPPDTGGIWACYTPGGFTFVGVTKEQQMKLVLATPY